MSSVTGARPTASPSLQLVLTSLFRADFVVLVKNRRAVVFSVLSPCWCWSARAGARLRGTLAGRCL